MSDFANLNAFKENQEKGIDMSYDEVLENIQKRDYNDMNRPTAPLKQAEDAVLADTSEYSFDESLGLLIRIVSEGMEGLK